MNSAFYMTNSCDFDISYIDEQIIARKVIAGFARYMSNMQIEEYTTTYNSIDITADLDTVKSEYGKYY